MQGNSIVIDRSGNEIGGAGPPSLVSSTISDPKLTPLHLVDGRMPSKGNEIAIDTWSAAQAKTRIGGTIKLATETPTRTYTVVGLIKFHGHRHRRRDVLDRHAEDRARDPRSQEPGRPHPDRGRAGRQSGTARREPEGRAPRLARGARHPDGEGRRPRDREARRGVRGHHPDDPARVRRRRPARRLVRHLQHVLDHGGPAHPRARAAAHARRCPPSGARERHPRGRDRRRSSPRRSARRSASPSLPGCSRCSPRRARRCPSSRSC